MNEPATRVLITKENPLLKNSKKINPLIPNYCKIQNFIQEMYIDINRHNNSNFQVFLRKNNPTIIQKMNYEI